MVVAGQQDLCSCSLVFQMQGTCMHVHGSYIQKHKLRPAVTSLSITAVLMFGSVKQMVMYGYIAQD